MLTREEDPAALRKEAEGLLARAQFLRTIEEARLRSEPNAGDPALVDQLFFSTAQLDTLLAHPGRVHVAPTVDSAQSDFQRSIYWHS